MNPIMQVRFNELGTPSHVGQTATPKAHFHTQLVD